jgi:N-acetylmuramoyl-L-alanine amidase
MRRHARGEGRPAGRRSGLGRTALALILIALAVLLADPVVARSHGRKKVSAQKQHRAAPAESGAATARARSTSPSAARAATTGSTALPLAAGGAAAAAGGRRSLPRLSGERVAVEEGVRAVLSDDGEIVVEARPHRGEALALFARRLCGDSRLVPQLEESNGGRMLAVGQWYRVPFEILSTQRQLEVARKLFPEDHGEAEGWRHHARGAGPLRRESLWRLAEWFTGKGENFRAVREHNHLRDDDVEAGTVVVIPSELLRPAFSVAVPVAEKPSPLEFGRDVEGEYAIYPLRPGEALYSAVVVRFTGRIYAADVNALAADIAKRNGIEDVTDIPAGFRVKIPVAVLQPEFLPPGDPRRAEYEAGLRASAQYSNTVQAKGLAGITVILDPGHGGHDSGAAMGGVWESLYVYDIALRVKALLEAQTAARVALTTRDGEDYRIEDRDVLSESRRHAVLTTPPYPILDAVIGVHLRWYLANSVFRRALEGGDSDPQKVVFLSIHADSLHPSLRGAMAYIPAAHMRDDSYGKSGAVYEARREYQESPRVTFPAGQRVASEGLSRGLAKQVIAAIEEQGLPVHPFTPVRDKIIRNGREWVPAVLRYNRVPAKMLLEVCNLANDQDRRSMQTRAYRNKISEAIVHGLLAYYGQIPNAAAVRVAKAAR